jgi:sugar phosphate isomerase/epimerase
MKSMIMRSLLILSLPALVFLNSCEKKIEKVIGLQLYSLRDEMKVRPDTTIQRVAEMGYAFVEPAGYANGLFYGMEPEAFKALVEENGMQIISSHAGQRQVDSTNWDKAMEWWDVCIDAHKRAGVKYIIQPSMHPQAYESIENMAYYCNYFNVVGEKCIANGMKFGYHNHSKEFGKFDSITIYDFMLQNTDPAKVLFEMDLYWVIEGGADPLAYFEKYPGRFELWHVKDEAELGASGKIDFASIYKEVEKSGMKYQVIEVEKYNFPPLESVKKSIDFLLEADFVK